MSNEILKFSSSDMDRAYNEGVDEGFAGGIVFSAFFAGAAWLVYSLVEADKKRWEELHPSDERITSASFAEVREILRTCSSLSQYHVASTWLRHLESSALRIELWGLRLLIEQVTSGSDRLAIVKKAVEIDVIAGDWKSSLKVGLGDVSGLSDWALDQLAK